MKGIIFLLSAVLFWALNFYLGKIMMEHVSPNVSAFWRYIFGVATLMVLTYSSFPSWSKIKANWQGIFLVGFVALFGFIYFFFQGLKYTSAMNGALIVSLNPATTILLAVIFQGYKPSKQQIGGVILAFFGVVYLLTKGDLLAIREIVFNRGDVLFLIANLLFALQNIWIKKYAADLGNLNFTTLTNLCCLLGFIPLVLIDPTFLTIRLPVEFWLSGIIMGVWGTALAYYCWNYGIVKVGAARGAVFINALPLFTALFAVAFGAVLFKFHLISAVSIIAGLLLVQAKGLRINSHEVA